MRAEKMLLALPAVARAAPVCGFEPMMQKDSIPRPPYIYPSHTVQSLALLCSVAHLHAAGFPTFSTPG
jgi:hypothetical protein